MIVSLLEGDILRHVVTLKMLHLHGDALDLRFAQDDDGWALLTSFPARTFAYDSQTYPDSDTIILVDGSSDAAKARLLKELPRGRLVIKTYDASVKQYAQRGLGATMVRSFLSYTTFPAAPHAPNPSQMGDDGSSQTPGAPRVLDSDKPSPEIGAMLAQNGYLDHELAAYFRDGSRWFAIKEGREFVSAGFVFRNFGPVWEVGGLYTKPDHRRKGHARVIVAAALRHLARKSLIPRYQVRSDNLPSIQLAESAGLQEFLRMDHFLASVQ
jgi:GNAT superfamily N-acetyltransferase